MTKQIYFELVGERNRMNSEYIELLFILAQKEKEIAHLDDLIKQTRESRKEVPPCPTVQLSL